MKYLKSFMLFEKISYSNNDTILIRYHLTGDIVPVSIKDVKSPSRFLVSFNIEGNPFPQQKPMVIGYTDIISRVSKGDSIETPRNMYPLPSTQTGLYTNDMDFRLP